MDSLLAQGLLQYVLFIPLLTFHEWAHAWTAWKCGDDTAYQRGRVSLNPIVHMELLGTVILPLAAILLSVSGSALAAFIIGWGRPVPVNLNNLSKPRLHDTLIAMAGPAMNILLAFLLIAIATLALRFENSDIAELAGRTATLSLFLAFFNLLPIPPLDGSHPMQHLVGMSWETYLRIARIGFILVIVALQIEPVRHAITTATEVTFIAMLRLTTALFT
jgi:Zn-dependent protease